MTKQNVMEAIQREWNAFVGLAEDFSQEDRIRPGAVGYWNVHETLLHVAAWDNETLLWVRQFRETGAKSGWLGQSADALDDLNERQVAEKRDLDPPLIWAHSRDTHQALVAFLETCDEHVFVEETFTGDSITTGTWKHYQGHGQDFARFKESL